MTTSGHHVSRRCKVLFLWPHPGLDYMPLSIVISSCCGKMNVDLGHWEPTRRGPWRPLHAPPCTGTQWVERSTPQVHVARTIWVPRGAVLPASPKDDLARRVVRLKVCFYTTPCLLSWNVDQWCVSLFIIFSPRYTWWNLRVGTFFESSV